MMRLEAEFPDPFGLASTPSAYIPRTSSERAMRALDNALVEGEIPALIGAPGLGKTLLLQRVAARLDDHTAPVYVPYSTLTLPELCKLVLGLVEEPVTSDPEEALRHIIQQLRRNRASLLLLIDDAAMMPAETALELAEWVEASKGALKLAVAAVESPEAREVFSAFGERLRLIRVEDEMSLDETRDYILRRLAIAGAPQAMRDAFDDETIELLYLEGRGNPRATNIAAQFVVRASLPNDTPLLHEVYDPTLYDIAFEDPTPFKTQTRSVSAEAAAVVRGESLFDQGSTADPSGPSADASDGGAAEEEGDHGSYRVVRGRRVKNAEGDLGSYEGRSTVERIPAGVREIAARINVEEAPPAETLAEAPQEILLETKVPLEEAPASPKKPVGGMRSIVSQILALGDAVSRQPMPAGISIVGAIAVGLACGSLLGPASVSTPSGQESAPAQGVAPLVASPVASSYPIGINATPWALIEVDGAQIGETPIAGFEISEGRHTFRAYFPDGEVEEKVVEIDASTRAVIFE